MPYRSLSIAVAIVGRIRRCMCPRNFQCSRPHHTREGAERRRPRMGRMPGLQHGTTGEALFIREQLM